MNLPGGRTKLKTRRRSIRQAQASVRHPETPRHSSIEAFTKGRGLSGHPRAAELSAVSVTHKEVSESWQDKRGSDRAFRSVSTPRRVSHLPTQRHVYRRKIAIPSEATVGRTADLLCAMLWRAAWQEFHLVLDTAGISSRCCRRIATEEQPE